MSPTKQIHQFLKHGIRVGGFRFDLKLGFRVQFTFFLLEYYDSFLSQSFYVAHLILRRSQPGEGDILRIEGRCLMFLLKHICPTKNIKYLHP